jgi:hypothetical protein
MTYTPQGWIVVEITGAEGKKIQKVLATWGASQCRLNSVNQYAEEFDDRWEFSVYSGSVYVCYKDCYGTSAFIERMYDNFEHEFKLAGRSIRIVEDYSV